jgi:hypothetical protein
MPTHASPAGANPIVAENQQSGSAQWQIPNAGFQVADDVDNQIKGYASAVSVNKGETLSFSVTVNPAQTFTIAIYRMGWYGGLGGRLMLQTPSISGIQEPPCPMVDASTMLVACSWSSSYTLAVPTSWTDGIYFAVLSNAQGYQNYVFFVLRDDARQAGLLHLTPVNTWEAVNKYGGKSLYEYNSTNTVRAYEVSFDRPDAGDGSWDYFAWDVYLNRWLEQQGYDVTYSTDLDAEINPSRLRSVKGVLIPGDSAYWTRGMYDAAEAAREAGVSLGFMGATNIHWQARYEDSPGGVANRVLVCYKSSDPPNPLDPITASNPGLTTTEWRLAPVNRPEQSLIGIQFTSQAGTGWDNTVPYVVTNSTNWVYANSGLSNGTRIAGLVGYEADRLWQEFPRVASQGQTFAVVANSPYTSTAGYADAHNAAIYQALSGAWVFASGSHSWVWGLSRPNYVNAGIQQTTTNILNRFLTNVPVAVTPTPTPPPPSSAYSSAIMADTPAGYWRLSEATGTVAVDRVGTHHGTYAYSPALGRPGALYNDPATSVGFNGTSQFVQAPTDASLNTSRFSFEIWARPTGGAGTYRGVMADRYYPQGWAVYLGPNNTWEFWINSGAGMTGISGGTASPNAWHHVVGTFDGTAATLYINGVAVASAALTSAYQPQTRAAVEIGQSEPGDNYYFPGQLEEPAMYATALSPSQIQHHFSVGTAGQ